MSMTETRAEAGAPAEGATPAEVVEPAGLAGWLTTADHKRVGRLYIAMGMLFLLVGSVLGEILGAERVDNGLSILDRDTFSQVYALHGEVAVFLFLVPLFLGLAIYLVPLQVG